MGNKCGRLGRPDSNIESRVGTKGSPCQYFGLTCQIDIVSGSATQMPCIGADYITGIVLASAESGHRHGHVNYKAQK